MTIILGSMVSIGGCNTNTQSSQKAAEDLGSQLAEYRAAQSDRVERLNREYSDAFAQLMNDFVALTNTKVQQSRDGDAQLIADGLIGEPKATLIGSLRTNFRATIQQQSDAIAQADIAVAAARDKYVSSYTEAKLSLAKVDKVQSDLRQLTEPADVFAGVAMFAQATVTEAEQLAQEAQQGKGSTPKSKVKPKSAQ